MSTAKIGFRLGGIDFTGEGDEKWVASQLDKVLEKAPSLMELVPASPSEQNDLPQSGGKGGNGNFTVTLAKFLQDHKAGGNQVRRFLATAEWLTKRGNANLATREISKALREAHQPRLSNPADCLNKNVSKGFCEKDGSHFFVTPEGRKSLGN